MEKYQKTKSVGDLRAIVIETNMKQQLYMKLKGKKYKNIVPNAQTSDRCTTMIHLLSRNKEK